jgi:alpha-beta hydrolase superfamily lysophospholipase
MDYNIRLGNGMFLKGLINSPGESPEAIVILIHGLGEHIQRYNHWSLLFNEKRIAFTGLDLPGHGRSEGRKGHISSYSITDEMLNIIITNTKKTFPGVPLFLYGHSLGGGILLDFLIRKKPEIKGAIVTSPWLKLSFEPSRSKVVLASVTKYILPWLTQPSGLVTKDLSHDQSVVDAYNNDPLVHDKISVSLFHNAMKAASSSLRDASSLNIPLLMLHGSDDKICSPEGSKAFAAANKSAELKIWDGGFHELHNEPFKMEVFTHIYSWMKRQIND